MLQSLENQPEKFAIMSKVQRIVVESLAMEPGFAQCHGEEKAKLLERAMEVHWADGDETRVMQALSAHDSILKARRGPVDCLAFPWYLTTQDWSKLLNGILNSSSKQDVIIHRLKKLNITTASEYSVKLFASLWMMVTHSVEELEGINWAVNGRRPAARDPVGHGMDSVARGAQQF